MLLSNHPDTFYNSSHPNICLSYINYYIIKNIINAQLFYYNSFTVSILFTFLIYWHLTNNIYLNLYKINFATFTLKTTLCLAKKTTESIKDASQNPLSTTPNPTHEAHSSYIHDVPTFVSLAISLLDSLLH